MPSNTAALWWLVLLLLHGVTAGFFGANAVFYHWLKDTALDYSLRSFHVGMEIKWYMTIGVVFALGALPHAVLVLKMIGAALITRSFAFGLGDTSTVDRCLSFEWIRRSALLQWLRLSLSRKMNVVNELVPAWHHSLSPSAWTANLRHALFGRDGLLGVDGRYFVRELVELSLQTTQAYRMSCYLPRMLPKRLYVSLLVANCWITPIIYAVTKKNETRRRLMRLSCDCALDFATSVAIPITILARYAGDFDLELQSFDDTQMRDKIWLANFVYEFQIVLVVSWQDLFMRLVFSLGMLHSVSGIKDLVGDAKESISSNQVSPHSIATTSIMPAVPNTHSKKRNGGRTHSRTKVPKQVLPANPAVFKSSVNASKAVHAALFLWGATILGLHLFAESHPTLPQCLFQVRPWGRSKAACALVDLDCNALKISGSADDMDVAWGILDPGAIEDLLIRHCNTLEMPSMLRKSSLLKTLKLYNTTLAAWDDDAALTATDHPNLASLFFVRVNLPDGELQPGLVSPDFPQSISSIYFCATNLRSLPTDLDTKWPSLSDLYLELSEFEETPVAATRLRSRRLSLYGNPIRELPSELFEMESVDELYIGRTLITSLPAHVAAVSSSIAAIYMTNTQVSFFPEWFDALVSRWSDESNWRPLKAGDTPYCDQLLGILDGSLLEFELTVDESGVSTTLPSVLMNSSTANQEVLSRIVSCKAFKVSWYWLSGDDEEYGLDNIIEEDGSIDNSISISTLS